MACSGTIAKKIWNFIKSLGPGVIFTTRYLLSFARRNTLDKNLSRFKQKGLIRWLADGVFMIPDEDAASPSAWEIMQAKANAFHKRVYNSSHDTHVFDTDGCRSSFGSIHGRLHFRSISPRKMRKRKQINSKQNEPVQKEITRERNEQTGTKGNTPQLSLISIVRKLQEMLAAAETRLAPHPIRKHMLRHSMSLQHF